MRQLPIAYLLLFSISLFSCHEESTVPSTGDLQLTAEGVAVTEVFLRLRIALNLHRSPSGLTLIQDGNAIVSITDPPADTLFIISGLVPKSNHTFHTKLQIMDLQVVASDPLTVTTIDTTSHNFTWEIDTLGDGASSVLNDVAIIDDTLVYAVGEMYLNDSAGNLDPEPYGISIMNGSKWHLKRVYPRYPGAINPPPIRATGLYACSYTSIFLADGGVWQWDGKSDTTNFRSGPFPSPDAGGSSLWGTSCSDLYAVGRSGKIAHFNGFNWQSLTSGTSLTVQDIWGTVDQISTSYEILCIASNKYLNTGMKVIKISGGAAITVSSIGLPWSLSGVWSADVYHHFVVGDGIFRTSSISDTSTWTALHHGVTTYYSHAIRGTSINNIFVVGAYGEILHFNGITWKSYLGQTAINGNLYSLAVRGNMIVAVGQVNNRAVAILGRR